MFSGKLKSKKTDWDSYYNKPYGTASYSRRISERVLVRIMKRFLGGNYHQEVAELGGANSCFFEAICRELQPSVYCAIDNNQTGLKKFKERILPKVVDARFADVFDLKIDKRFDVVFSFGLIEHFDEEGTNLAIKAHFDLLKEDGVAVIFFPTPTFLYRLTRKLAEFLRIWIFFDERPLTFQEVEKEVLKYSTILHKEINWPIFLTQGIIVCRK